MFSKQPPPLPHCENLTDAQVKLVHKIIANADMVQMERYANIALKKGWNDVFIAVAKMPRNERIYFKPLFLNCLLDVCDSVLALAVMSHINGYNEKEHADMVVRMLRKFDEATRQRIVEMQISPSIRGAVVAELITHLGKEDDGELATCLLKLLMPPTDVHYNKGSLMKRALINGHFEVADALRKNGFDLAAYAVDIKTAMTAGMIQSPYMDEACHYVDDYMPRVSQELAPVVEDVLITPILRYRRTGDQVSCNDTLPDGSVLTTVFNFSSAQQMVFVRVGDHISAPAIVPFKDIENRGQLDEAAADYLRQDGNPELIGRLSALAVPHIVLSKRGAKNNVS